MNTIEQSEINSAILFIMITVWYKEFHANFNVPVVFDP